MFGGPFWKTNTSMAAGLGAFSLLKKHDLSVIIGLRTAVEENQDS